MYLDFSEKTLTQIAVVRDNMVVIYDHDEQILRFLISQVLWLRSQILQILLIDSANRDLLITLLALK